MVSMYKHLIIQYISDIVSVQNYFQSLSSEGFFDGTDQDKIAFLAIYMPIVREAIMSYVQLWNTHSIRKQKDRPNAITGKPAVLYNYTPDIVRYGRPIDESLVNELQADFGNQGKYYFFILIFTNLVIVRYITNGIIDIDAYLPTETLKWCRDRLLESGVNLEEVQGSTTSIDGSRIHRQVYLTLRPLV